ncbi:hypothetical protein EVAR_28350_1 [Eumeta japonica]|uniref:Uncharacterized protein n=1 Tax=Eumeta variegata TaxID=151549 RepID=A0A4C1V8G1_EUMVA|nr:hypothetical protein EVAR_28350_1 [Eumeta japonica]
MPTPEMVIEHRRLFNIAEHPLYRSDDVPQPTLKMILLAVLCVAAALPQYYTGYGGYLSGYPSYTGYASPYTYGGYSPSAYGLGYGYY